jgi:Cu(I)/Ag(I) efflux system membrane fusion protein
VQPAPVTAQVELTAPQRAAMNRFLAAADAASATLAADQLQQFNQATPPLASELDRLAAAFPADHPWATFIAKVQAQGKLAPAGDLAEARRSFLPFSTSVVEFLRVARQQDPGTRLKIYRCPMAPKPGFWMQLDGPLRNPYFGKEMLDCGSEVP